jgi:acetyl esterase
VRHISVDGTIHGHINIRKGIPSAQGDVESYVTALKEMLAEIIALNTLVGA